MSKIPYTKQALTFDEQIKHLRRRGMVFADVNQARDYLCHINYYRLAAYWLPFEADHASHQFEPGTTFEAVLERYIFDRELRMLVLDAIERVEVAMRTQFAYQLGHIYGAHALLNEALFQPAKNNWAYQDGRQQLIRDACGSKEVFMQHLLGKYCEPLPPIWASVEIMTLGQLSKWYANLKLSADRNRIANAFDFDEVNLVSFMHHLAIVRNVCAHHSRLWNRDFAFTFKLPCRRPITVLGCLNPAAPKKLYNTLVVLACLLDAISPSHQWKKKLISLMQTHHIPDAAMGFPSNWQGQPIWQ